MFMGTSSGRRGRNVFSTLNSIIRSFMPDDFTYTLHDSILTCGAYLKRRCKKADGFCMEKNVAENIPPQAVVFLDYALMGKCVSVMNIFPKNTFDILYVRNLRKSTVSHYATSSSKKSTKHKIA